MCFNNLNSESLLVGGFLGKIHVELSRGCRHSRELLDFGEDVLIMARVCT